MGSPPVHVGVGLDKLATGDLRLHSSISRHASRTQPAGTPISLKSAPTRCARATCERRFELARQRARGGPCGSPGGRSAGRSSAPGGRRGAEGFELLLLVRGDVERAAGRLNVPDGAAVKFSLPIGCGSTPAFRWLDTTQPIAASVASSIDTSMRAPSPGVALLAPARPRSRNAAVMPAIVSEIGKPVRRGAVCGVAGDAHHAREALDDLVVGGRGPTHGPSWPKPEMAQ